MPSATRDERVARLCQPTEHDSVEPPLNREPGTTRAALPWKHAPVCSPTVSSPMRAGPWARAARVPWRWPVPDLRRVLAKTTRLRQYDANVAKAGGRMAKRERERVPFCWFCPATSGRKSKEHIFPQWLSAHYGARTEVVTPHRFSAMTGELLSERPSKPLSGFKSGDVCGECNNGWMSQVEDRVGLDPDRRQANGSAHPDEAGALAHWFVNIAAVLNVSRALPATLPRA